MSRIEEVKVLTRQIHLLEDQLRQKNLELEQLLSAGEPKRVKPRDKKRLAKQVKQVATNWINADDKDLYIAILEVLKGGDKRTVLGVTDALKQKKIAVTHSRVQRCLNALKKGKKVKTAYERAELKPGFHKTANVWFLP